MKNEKLLTTQNMILIAMFAAILCILAPFTIPLPIVPLSLAPFIIVITGTILGPKLGATSVLIYILLGLFGLPVYSNHTAGPGILLGATGGFLFGYIIMVFLVGLGKNKNLLVSIACAFAGLVVCYLCGIISLRIVTSSFKAVAGLPLLFVKDFAVSVVAILIGSTISKRISFLKVNVTNNEKIA